MLGHVSESEAAIWVKASEPASLAVKVSTRSDLSNSRTIRGAALKPETDAAGVIRMGDLSPNQTYHYSILLDGKEALHPPYPSFKTPPAATAGTGRLRFCFVSCSGYQPYEPAAGWADIATRTNMDLILMLGDNHYANSSDKAAQRKAYLGQRSSPGFLAATRSIPVYGIWDDHDFGPNDSDGSLPGKDMALSAFLEHWANPGAGERENPGIYFKFSRGDVEFFCLDGRYHRSPNRSPVTPEKTMLGARQLEWFKESLTASKARIKVLVSGSEWQSYGTPDSWTSFARERDDLFQFIDHKGIQGVILISGDRHFTAAYQVQGRFIEVTSGPIGGNASDSRVTPEMFINHNKGRFYCIYDIDTSGSEPRLTLEIYQIGTGLVTHRSFTWDEICGRTRIPSLPSPTPSPKP